MYKFSILPMFSIFIPKAAFIEVAAVIEELVYLVFVSILSNVYIGVDEVDELTDVIAIGAFSFGSCKVVVENVDFDIGADI